MKPIFLLLSILFSFNGGAQNLSDSIPYPYYEEQNQSENKVMSIESGIAALQLRLEMIRRARSSIDLEYFIYNTDDSGKIITRELVQAAQRGVKVRILIDKSLPIFQFDEYYAKELAQYGIEVRYYNAAPLIRISTVQFRNHRKLLLIDGREAITGGRNIGDDYFDLSSHFNFDDRDIYIKGRMVRTIRTSFEKYFEHEISERPEFPQKPAGILSEKKLKEYLERTAKAKAFLQSSERERSLLEHASRVGGRVLANKKLHTCPSLTFSTDAPGADFFARLSPSFDENYRFLRKTLFDKISVVDKKILLSSPYILNNSHSRNLMKSLLAKKVDIDIYTNSLASTDAVYVAANLYLTIKNWSRSGINIYLHDGNWLSENYDTLPEVKVARWGTHEKVQIYETKNHSEVMIGTYNIDNRSNFYNSEMGVFCKGNDKFTDEVKQSILSRAAKGIKVNQDGSASDAHGEVKSIYGSSSEDLKLMKVITLPSWLLKFLL